MQQALIRSGERLKPLDVVAGFKIRPGLYSQNGAVAIPNAVSFTIHSHHATSVELCLFKRKESK